jgi:predicted N-acetyltransferase YhbS
VSAPLVRPLATEDEIAGYFRLGAQTFAPERELEPTATRWRRFIESEDTFAADHLRGAFEGDAFLGGYALYDRRTCLAGAWLRVACLGGVVTHPDHRRRGVGRALMHDAIAYAQERGYALLLLGGIPNFYARFGYADVVDDVEHAVLRANALAHPPSPYTVRPATVADAPELLALYERHYGARPGGFTRTLARQAQRLADGPPGRSAWLAFDERGRACGYLIVAPPPRHWRAIEVAADDWPAALALLQYQAHWFDDEPEPPAELRWAAPFDGVIYYQLCSALTMHAVPPGAEHGEEWSVRSHILTLPNGGWLARLANTAALLEALLPAWRARARGWTGRFTLALDEQRYAVEFTAHGAQVAADGTARAPAVALSGAAFCALLFGYRPLAWALAQPGQSIAPELLELFGALFAAPPAWIAGTDGF